MIWQVRGISIVLPKLKDPRVFMIGVLTLYTIVGHTLLAFDHHLPQILTCVLIACILDTTLNFVKTKQIILPVSGIITGMSLGLLIESIPLWPYIVAPILAISSKSLIQFQKRHVFNPSNFGLVVLLLLTPKTVSTVAAQWGGTLFVVLVIVMVGGFTTYRVSRWDLVVSFLISFCLMGLVENAIAHTGLAFVIGPIFGAAFQLFTLSMITDPKTTPDTRQMRVIFGVSLAIVDGILRLMNNQYSLFIALLLIASCVPLLRACNALLKQRATNNQQSIAMEPLEVQAPVQ